MGMYFLNHLRQLRHCDNEGFYMDKRFQKVLATKARQTATRQVPSKFVAASRYAVASLKGSVFLYEKRGLCRNVAIVAWNQDTQRRNSDVA